MLVTLTDFFILFAIVGTVFTILAGVSYLIIEILPEKLTDKIFKLFPFN